MEMNIFLVEVEILQLNTKTRLPEVCFWKARGVRISLSRVSALQVRFTFHLIALGRT